MRMKKPISIFGFSLLNKKWYIYKGALVAILIIVHVHYYIMTRFIKKDGFDNYKDTFTIIVIFIFVVTVVFIALVTAPKCPKCDDVIRNSDRFCKHCGYKLRNN